MHEFFFKYTSYVFEQGRFVMAADARMMLVAAVLGIAAVPVIWRYTGVTAKTRRFDRLFLATLRVAILGVVLFLLLRPSLAVETAVPQENFVGVVIDDSSSMRIRDYGGEGTAARSEFVREVFGDPGSDLMTALGERFKLRFFRFSDASERLEGIQALSYGGQQTHIGPALEFAQQELSAVPLSGLVVVTDGADNSLEGLSDSLQALRASAVPVFPVGVGAERFDRDIEVASVEAPRTVLAGSQIAADVVVEHKGFGGEQVLLLVEGPEGVIGTEEVELPRQGDSTVVKAHFTATQQGPHLYGFRIAVEDGEMVRENNQRDVLLVVQDRQDKILYAEGEPTYNVKFMRRALSDDPNVLLGIFLRMAENKFIRYDFESEEELAGGFPTTREELFQYKGLILGSFEADFFTDDQRQMIHDFVSQRGGGFMMMGGRHSFGEGGWRGTPVEDILPVEMVADFGAATDAEADGSSFIEVNVRPTLFGRTHPVTQMADSVETSLQHWETLPPVGLTNRLGDTKPGAVSILEGTTATGEGPYVSLAFQRFGRGKTLAFAPSNSWLWQMAYEIPLDDMTHETLWQQLLRWLVNDAPGQVAVSTVVDRYTPGAPVTLTATVVDDNYIEINNAGVTAIVTSPSGVNRQLALDWTIDADGEYEATFVPDETGFHQIYVEASLAGETLGTDTGHIDVAELSTEAFAAERRTALLDRIAEETGGRAYTPQNVDDLPGDLRFSEGGTTVLEVKDLWDMPIIFMLLVLLIGGEWGYRKLRGLA